MQIETNTQGVAAYQRSIQHEQVGKTGPAQTQTVSKGQPPTPPAEAANVEAADAAQVSDAAVARIKSEIQAGTYLTDEKVDAAIDKLFRSLTTEE
jgi:anti-sigma28 factor (negative regulator of flagellin synthesis)